MAIFKISRLQQANANGEEELPPPFLFLKLSATLIMGVFVSWLVTVNKRDKRSPSLE